MDAPNKKYAAIKVLRIPILYSLALILASTTLYTKAATQDSLSGLYKKTAHERIELVQQKAHLNAQETDLLEHSVTPWANHMVENSIGTLPVPLGIAAHFLINGKEYLVPMATEEPSVIAAASNAAKKARSSGGFTCWASEQIMIGQIQCKAHADTDNATIEKKIKEHKQELLGIANRCNPLLEQRGAGAKDIQVRFIQTSRGSMVIVHLIIDVKDAMGANSVNTMLETIAPDIQKLIPLQCAVKILSNLPLFRIAKATALWRKELIGADVIEKILDMQAWALADPFRCATHNKGIMNGIDALALATGNDIRAIEAGAHAFASYQKEYAPLTHYSLTETGDLKGEIEIPLSVGILGGSIQSNPTAQLCLKILGVTSAQELACTMAAVGLAQNFAALHALVTSGIQAGHMKLQSKNVAIAAGVPASSVDAIALKMYQESTISVQRAQELVTSMIGALQSK